MKVLILILTYAAIATSFEFDYDQQDFWNETYPRCGGNSQSPVDFDTSTVIPTKHVHHLEFHGYDTNINSKYCTLFNNGHTVELTLNLPNKLSPFVRGGQLSATYYLKSLHFHWNLDVAFNGGSEHTVNGKHFDVEGHLVHVNSKYESMQKALDDPEGLLVVGVFFKIDDCVLKSSLSPITDALPIDTNDQVSLPGKFSVHSLFPIDPNLPYYTYPGSLTTPPCAEAVTWIVFQQVVSLSHSAWLKILRLRNSIGVPIYRNVRKTKPLGNRNVNLVY